MERLAEIFRTATGKQMTIATHAVGLPWHQVYEVEGRHWDAISYALALDSKPGSVTEEHAEEIELESRAAVALFK
ncbi:MAG: hypothetical protein F9K40_14240 [Kofleriaceae bacterium]|nr:MAG: hypothetical protein F9K40_14240 [Kofleriaceae bacterium]